MTQAAAPYTFNHTARTPLTACVVAGLWALLLAAWWWMEAATWLVLLLVLFTLPAVLDLLRNPASGLRLSEDHLSWYAGRHDAQIALAEIDHVRLDTRLDFSVRASAVLHSGRKIRLPFEATPPHQAFEDALQAKGVKTRRHHFQLFQ